MPDSRVGCSASPSRNSVARKIRASSSGIYMACYRAALSVTLAVLQSVAHAYMHCTSMYACRVAFDRASQLLVGTAYSVRAPSGFMAQIHSHAVLCLQACLHGCCSGPLIRKFVLTDHIVNITAALKFAFQITENDRLYYYSYSDQLPAVEKLCTNLVSLEASPHQSINNACFLRVTGHYICWPIH